MSVDVGITLRKLLISSLLAVILISIAPSFPQNCSAPLTQRIVINSVWTSNPPSIDGVFNSGEWTNPQLTLTKPAYPITAYAYFTNDVSNLYVMVDSVGDATDSTGDECLLVFNFILFKEALIIGPSGTTTSNNYNAAIGYGGSPNNSSSHKIYEFSIPLSFIGGVAGQPIDFSSPPFKGGASMTFDSETGRDNVWPANLNVQDQGTWGLIQLALLRPVGGILLPTNKLEILTPYLALVGLAAALSTIAVVRKRSKA
jgi:hypothetical protein